MKESIQDTKKPLILFALAALFTFGFITLLQFAPMPWFFVALLAMHGGIALFIISKRMFKSQELAVSQFYRTQYILLIPYLFVMFYTFASKAGIVPLFTTEKTAFVLIYSVLCGFITIWNYLRLKKSLENQSFQNTASFARNPE